MPNVGPVFWGVFKEAAWTNWSRRVQESLQDQQVYEYKVTELDNAWFKSLHASNKAADGKDVALNIHHLPFYSLPPNLLKNVFTDRVAQLAFLAVGENSSEILQEKQPDIDKVARRIHSLYLSFHKPGSLELHKPYEGLSDTDTAKFKAFAEVACDALKLSQVE